MSHSHMPVKHLLKQVENYRSQRGQRDVRPDWLTGFIDHVADLFEPISDVGRVGFHCRLAEDCWKVTMYLGNTEIVGGRDDGQSQRAGFQLSLRKLTEQFTQIDQFLWNFNPDGPGEDGTTDRSNITIEGRVGEHPICLQLDSIPPTDAGPGFRQYQDGRRDPV